MSNTEETSNVKKKKIIIIAIAVVLVAIIAIIVAVASGKKEAVPEVASAPTATPTPTPSNTPTPTSTPTSTPTPTPDPYEGMIRSPLNNEYIDASYENTRPIAVMFNNVKAALPQCGISHAGVVYESLVEGGITRLLGVIKDYDTIDTIGSVRSVRKYYVYWALEYDSIIVHYGGPAKYVSEILSASYVNNINGTTSEQYFYRTSDRVAPHNAFTSATKLASGIEGLSYSSTYTDNYQGDHFKFADDENPNLLEAGATANEISPGYLNEAKFVYNSDDSLYYRYEYGEEQVDGNTGEQLAYKNVIIQYTPYEVLDKNGYLAFSVFDGGSGYYFTNGKYIDITWSKESTFAPTKYFDSDGNEIELNTGNTWICICPPSYKSSVSIK